MIDPMMANLGVETAGFFWFARVEGIIGWVDHGMEGIARPGPHLGFPFGAEVDCVGVWVDRMVAGTVEVKEEGDRDANFFAAIDMKTAETGGRCPPSELSESSMLPEYCQNIEVNGKSERTTRMLVGVVVYSCGADVSV